MARSSPCEGRRRSSTALAAGVGLEAAAVPAAADRPVLVHQHVADLAGRSAVAAVEPAADQEPAADARGEHQVDHLRGVAAGAEHGLGECAQVRVVVDVNRQAEALLELGRPRRGPTQPGMIVVEPSVPVSWSIGPETATPAPSTRSRSMPERSTTSFASAVATSMQAAASWSTSRSRPASARMRWSSAASRHAHEAVVEVDAEHGAGARVEREEHGRPAAARARGVATVRALHHQPGAVQIADQAGDRRARQSRLARDLRPAHRAALAHGFEHAEAVQLAERGEGAGVGRRHDRATLPYRWGFCQGLTELWLLSECCVRIKNKPPPFWGLPPRCRRSIIRDPAKLPAVWGRPAAGRAAAKKAGCVPPQDVLICAPQPAESSPFRRWGAGEPS